MMTQVFNFIRKSTKMQQSFHYRAVLLRGLAPSGVLCLFVWRIFVNLTELLLFMLKQSLC